MHMGNKVKLRDLIDFGIFSSKVYTYICLSKDGKKKLAI